MEAVDTELAELHASTKEVLLAWMDQFENDHYVVDVYGEMVTAEYEALESKVRDQYPEDSAWLLHVMIEAVGNDHL